jgi:acyl-CoA thioesterase FadM
MYVKHFEFRWRDLYANRHHGNSAYINFMSHSRMANFYEKGFSQEVLTALDFRVLTREAPALCYPPERPVLGFLLTR